MKKIPVINPLGEKVGELQLIPVMLDAMTSIFPRKFPRPILVPLYTYNEINDSWQVAAIQIAMPSETKHEVNQRENKS